MKNSSCNDYLPSENEEYMNEQQLHYFEYKLLKQQQELEEKIQSSIRKLKTLKSESSDMIDLSNHEHEIDLELKRMARNTNMLNLSQNALQRIKNGYFGYCVITGQAIGIKRLDLIPTTTMSIDAMRMFERDRGMECQSVMEYAA